jgi:hypothetical protein
MATGPDDRAPEVPRGPPNLIDDVKYWRDRAKDARAKADQARNHSERTLLLDAAKQYDDLAEIAELRLREKS